MKALGSIIIAIVFLTGVSACSNRDTHDWEQIEDSIQYYLDDFTVAAPGEDPPDAKHIMQIIKDNKINDDSHF
ncbi:hypothetical protein OAF99_02385 [Akkermansiaceae bacterium]|nr:hypothetical protein [Akkermansiaceae bacterium]